MYVNILDVNLQHTEEIEGYSVVYVDKLWIQSGGSKYESISSIIVTLHANEIVDIAPSSMIFTDTSTNTFRRKRVVNDDLIHNSNLGSLLHNKQQITQGLPLKQEGGFSSMQLKDLHIGDYRRDGNKLLIEIPQKNLVIEDFDREYVLADSLEFRICDHDIETIGATSTIEFLLFERGVLTKSVDIAWNDLKRVQLLRSTLFNFYRTELHKLHNGNNHVGESIDTEYNFPDIDVLEYDPTVQHDLLILDIDKALLAKDKDMFLQCTSELEALKLRHNL